MLEIQEKFTTDGYEALASSASSDSFHITEAVDKGEVIGFIAYSYETDKTIVYDYDDGGDLMLCDGLVRSVIFKSCLKAIETMDFQLSDEKKYDNLRKLKFLAKDSKTAEKIDGFMNGCQNCRHNN
jgi:hypothetical protein rflaF_12154